MFECRWFRKNSRTVVCLLLERHVFSSRRSKITGRGVRLRRTQRFLPDGSRDATLAFRRDHGKHIGSSGTCKGAVFAAFAVKQSVSMLPAGHPGRKETEPLDLGMSSMVLPSAKLTYPD